MNRYLVISPHTAEECKHVIEQVLATGYITHFDWGCSDGDHTGWAVLEAENAQQALLAVPSSQRPTARIVRLTRFSPEEIEKIHHEK